MPKPVVAEADGHSLFLKYLSLLNRVIVRRIGDFWESAPDVLQDLYLK